MEVIIEKLDHFGRGICFVNNKICFVENALPLELVEIKITKETTKYFLGKVTKILKESKERMVPSCCYATVCGGCQLQHLKFESENNYKTIKIKEIMQKYANITEDKVKDIIAAEPYYYRNKISFHIKNKKLGLYQKGSNELVEINKCLLLESRLNDEIPKLKKGLTLTNNSITMRVGNDTNDLMITIDNKSTPNHILSKIGKKEYLVSPQSFFQINKTITNHLYEEIKQIVKNKASKKVLDLYCGTGTIAIYISDVVTKVLGIESCQAAIKDANKNKEKNDCYNCTFHLGKVEDLTAQITKQYDTIIVDPPRNGLDKKVVEKLLEITPANIIYISCDPITLARDLKELTQQYEIEYIKPYNMFPRTYHVECLTLLQLKGEKNEARTI